jgi:PII-like signaling protein
MKEQFQARMLRIHFGEGDKCQGKPLHEAIVAKASELGLADAIVYRGIEGFGSSTRIHHASHWTLSSDAPIMVSIIDTEDQIAEADPSFGCHGGRRPDRNIQRGGHTVLTESAGRPRHNHKPVASAHCG